MNICIVCNNEFEGKRAGAKYCSDKCRVTNNRNKPDEINVTLVTDNAKSVTDNVTDNSGVIIDCNGTPHQIDYAGRKASFIKMLDWAGGKGNEYQYRLGRLSLQYTTSKGIDIGKYLGMAGNELKAVIDRLKAIKADMGFTG